MSNSDILSATLAVLPDLEALVLFGSKSDGTDNLDSDIDLAVMAPSPFDPVQLWEAGEDIARRLNIDVDLIDLRTASTVMQHRIVTTGRRLFAKNHELDLYEAFVFSEMLDLNEARGPLIADILKEGRIHGR